MKSRSDLEAEAIRLIRAVENNIVLDAKEVLVQALDQMQVDGAKWAAEQCNGLIDEEPHNDFENGENSGVTHFKSTILEAIENREKI